MSKNIIKLLSSFPENQILSSSLSSTKSKNITFCFSSRRHFGGSHIYLGKHHDYNQWELIAPERLQNVIKPTNLVYNNNENKTLQINDNTTTLKKNMILRGTSLHGPESSSVIRLALWNRLKQRKPQREVPTIEEMRGYNKLEVSCVWFTWGYLLFYCMMASYGGCFAMENDRYPWLPPRTDGSRGDGPMFWYLE